jgi:hypothetical protein
LEKLGKFPGLPPGKKARSLNAIGKPIRTMCSKQAYVRFLGGLSLFEVEREMSLNFAIYA